VCDLARWIDSYRKRQREREGRKIGRVDGQKKKEKKV